LRAIMKNNKFLWLEWAKRIKAIAQNGLAYSENEFDIERYQQLQVLAAEIIEQYSNHSFEKVHNILAKEDGYATPKVDVRGVVFKNDKILLVKEKSDGKWTLPGGWADVHATPTENVVREIREESGYVTKVVRLLAVYDRSKHPHYPQYPFHFYKMFFLCEITGGSLKPGLETTDCGFFTLDDLPELSTRRITFGQIRSMFELRNEQQTECD
jgi:ADP-ribose pyrophosphatase YjhB (NUDIX family)